MRSLLALTLLFGYAAALPLAAQIPAPATADDPVAVNVLSDRVAIGEMGQLFIKVRKVDATMPERIETAGLEVVFSGQQSSINIINGVQTVETTYFYRFSGDEPGTFTIPEFEIRVGERVVKTRPIVITVFERDGTEVALDATNPISPNSN